jgi:hypothetical protein
VVDGAGQRRRAGIQPALYGRATREIPTKTTVSGSPCVTAAGVNPTNTIQALALHIGDSIKKNLANLFD